MEYTKKFLSVFIFQKYGKFWSVISSSINLLFLKSVYAALRAEKNIDDVISPSTYLLSICDIFLETLFVDTNSR